MLALAGRGNKCGRPKGRSVVDLNRERVSLTVGDDAKTLSGVIESSNRMAEDQRANQRKAPVTLLTRKCPGPEVSPWELSANRRVEFLNLGLEPVRDVPDE